MHRLTVLLLVIAIGLSMLSGIYFTGQAFGWPFPITVAGVIGVLVPVSIGIFRIVRKDLMTESNRSLEIGAAVLVLVGAVACGLRARVYGDWDAALIWNLHARHLTTAHWRQLFEPMVSGNSTYPYGLPGTIAFFWRICGTFTPVVPFLMALLPTLAIPVLVLVQSGKPNWIKIGLAALAFGTYRYYFALGLAQYADIQIAFLLLLLFIVAERLRATALPDYGYLLGALCGALCWTKMEGFLLTGLFLLFNLPLLRKTPVAIFRLVLGGLPFAGFWWLLRSEGAPDSTLWIPAAKVLANLQEAGRWKTVGQDYAEVLFGRHFRLVAVLLLAWIFRKRISRTGIRLVLTMMAAYFGIYVLLTVDLDWNVFTSLPRLLLQLYPLLTLLVVSAAPEPASSTSRRSGA